MLLPDLSEFQSSANLSEIRKRTPAVIIRAAYGLNHTDHVFVDFRNAAHSEQYTFVGIYHYLVAGQDAAAQASAFCTLLGKLRPGEIPILDLEEGSGDQSGRAIEWFTVVDAYFGLDKLPLNQRSWLYTYQNFAKDANLMGIINSARHDWLAAYSQVEPTIPHTLWQSSDGETGKNTVSWPGVGFCDTNEFSGTASQLASYAWHPVTTTPAPQEEEMLNVQVVASDRAYVPFPSGSFKQFMVYADFVDAIKPGQVRVAVHSASKGYTVHVVDLTSTSPMSFNFPQADTDSVSIVNSGNVQVGVTLS